MKSLLVSGLLAGAAMAAPAPFGKSRRLTVRFTPLITPLKNCKDSDGPSQGAMKSAMALWNDDMVALNAFIDNPQGGAAVQGALAAANDEVSQIAVVGGICLSGSSSGPVSDYEQGLDDIGAPLQTGINTLQNIVSGAVNPDPTPADLSRFLQDRCCTLLPVADKILLGAAEDYGLVGAVNTTAPRPAACGSVDCGGSIQASDPFGEPDPFDPITRRGVLAVRAPAPQDDPSAATAAFRRHAPLGWGSSGLSPQQTAAPLWLPDASLPPSPYDSNRLPPSSGSPPSAPQDPSTPEPYSEGEDPSAPSVPSTPEPYSDPYGVTDGGDPPSMGY